MYIERIPNRNSPPAVLLRESYREDGKVRKRTLANLSKLPTETVDDLKILLKGGKAVEDLEETFKIIRSRPHGHVAATLSSLRKLGLHNLIDSSNSRIRRIVEAMIVARIVNPASKLATARGKNRETFFSSLGEILGLEGADEDELYLAMDFLLERQEDIENHLAKIHLKEGCLVLYDVSSTYLEGKACPLARYGYNRDKKRGKLQIVFGLLCNDKGCPIAVEVFEGNTSDPKTFTNQIEKVSNRFGIERVVWVGDRGMITQARIREDLKDKEGLDWISALRAPQIKKLVEQSAIQLSLFDEQNLASISCEDYPGERLIACRNPLLAAERKKNREELLQATERELNKIVVATSRKTRPLTGEDNIGIRVGKVINKFNVEKHFIIEIKEDSFSYQRNHSKINAEAILDGLYVIRTSLKEETLSATDTVKAYKNLSQVEQAFRSYKTVDLKVRPIYHHIAERVKAHIFLCMLAYYVEWHMRELLAPILFDVDALCAASRREDDWENATSKKESVVSPTKKSDKAKAKAQKKRTPDNLPVHSFQTLLDDLATIVKNTISTTIGSKSFIFEKITQPTPIQQRAIDLLEISMICTQ